jgi:hypothetical protein
MSDDRSEPEQDKAAGEKARQARKRRKISGDPKVFVLHRELSEVHLLLDNVSANPATTVSEQVAVKRPPLLDDDWIEEVCEINWPPDEGTDQARDAALLIAAKDYLNRLASPASGSTIAFTLLVTQEEEAKRRRQRRQSNVDDENHSVPSRSSLAETAYPDLMTKAVKFRKAMWWMCIGLVVALLMTCILSWYVAYGNAALADLKTAQANFVEVERQVNQAAVRLNEEPAPTPDGDAEVATTPADSAPVPATDQVAPYCDGNSYGLPGRLQSCTALDRAEDELWRVKKRLADWLCWAPWKDCLTDPAGPGEEAAALRRASSPESDARLAAEAATPQETDRPPLPVRPQATARTGSAPARKAAPQGPQVPSAEVQDERLEEAAPRAAALATVLGSAVLPFLYGLLGAGAAIIRSLSRKIRASLLSPRDLHLSFQQLALGAVVGACIGLFIAAPGTEPGEDSLLGPVTLSGSAISFIAGFGVDAVFEALETLIRRIFNVAPPAAGNRGDGVASN